MRQYTLPDTVYTSTASPQQQQAEQRTFEDDEGRYERSVGCGGVEDGGLELARDAQLRHRVDAVGLVRQLVTLVDLNKIAITR